MGNDRFAVDLLSLHEFHQQLRQRLDDANMALLALTRRTGTQWPPVGHFEDALRTTHQHHLLHDQFVDRLRTLIIALTTAQEATATIIDQFRTMERLNRIAPEVAKDILRPVSEALDASRSHA